MSESTNAVSTEEAAEKTARSEDFTPITSQADLDKIVGARLAREKQKYADYETLREKASKADKDAAELAKAREKIADYEAKAQHDTWVREAALEYEVPENLLRGDTLEDLKAHAASLQAALNKAAPKVPVLPDQGKAPDSSLSELQKAARQLFNRD